MHETFAEKPATKNCGINEPIDDMNRVESLILWTRERFHNERDEKFKKIPDEELFGTTWCYRFNPTHNIVNTYAYLLENPEAYYDEERVHRILNEIEDRINSGVIWFQNHYIIKNTGWNLNTDFTTFHRRNYAAMKFYIMNEVNSMADLYQLFHYFMPSLNNRMESICEAVARAMDVMIHSVESRWELYTEGLVHAIFTKGAKVLIELASVRLGFVVMGLYAIFKTLDAVFIFRREARYYVPDPKLHCEYFTTSNGRFKDWLFTTDKLSGTLKQIGVYT